MALHLSDRDRRRRSGRIAGLIARVRSRREHAAEDALGELAAGGYRVLDDIVAGPGRVDHVVVGSTGVYAVATTPWSDLVHAPGIARRSDDDLAVRRLRANAVALRRRLEREGMEHWVHAVYTVTGARVPAGSVRCGSVTVVEAQALATHVRAHRPYLEADEVQRVVRALVEGAEARSA